MRKTIYNNNLRDAKQNLEEFFEEGTWILRGTVNRWDGAYQAGTIFTDIISTFNKMIKGCDYVHIYSENGHLYFQCTHHDGVNIFEIKKLTEKGERYFENWENGGIDDKRSEEYIHDQIMKRYSILPRYE